VTTKPNLIFAFVFGVRYPAGKRFRLHGHLDFSEGSGSGSAYLFPLHPAAREVGGRENKEPTLPYICLNGSITKRNRAGGGPGGLSVHLGFCFYRTRQG